MHPHAEVIEQFYHAFQQRDAEGMIACYHPNVTFADPVFRQLSVTRPGRCGICSPCAARIWT